MRHTRTTICVLLLVLVTATGCAGAKEAVETTVQQGIETTSTGVHNTVPANEAQGAVDAANGAIQQVPQPEDISQ